MTRLRVDGCCIGAAAGIQVPRSNFLQGGPFSERPTIYSHDGPNSFHEPERPRALEKAINRAENTPTGECQDEPMAPVLERVRDQHGRHGEQAERCQSVHRSPPFGDSKCPESPVIALPAAAHRDRRSMPRSRSRQDQATCSLPCTISRLSRRSISLGAHRSHYRSEPRGRCVQAGSAVLQPCCRLP